MNKTGKHNGRCAICYGTAQECDNGPRHDANLVEEKEANIFARALLMPTFMMEKEHQPADIHDLAKRYQVPIEQVVLRLQELGMIF